jgi:exopolyphosphatase/guanosine-5'-triphosphate,3'-diphosphate pyrophosphatase
MSGGRAVPDVLAAVDLGSNSFHMVVARYSHGQLVILDRLREMVRLAGGLGDSGRLDDAATERALALPRALRPAAARHARRQRAGGGHQCLAPRQAQALVPGARARALGPSHRNHFGTGRGAAHLLGRGAHQSHEPGQTPGHRHRRRLDRSGDRRGIHAAAAGKPVGGLRGFCASCFDDGRISEKRFERARTAVRLELEPIQEAYKKLGWLQAFGSSGTVRVIGDVVRRLNPDSPRITSTICAAWRSA